MWRGWCRNCAGNSVVGASADYWNKFYVKRIYCPNGSTAAAHLASQSTFQGQEAHKYNIVIPV